MRRYGSTCLNSVVAILSALESNGFEKLLSERESAFPNPYVLRSHFRMSVTYTKLNFNPLVTILSRV